jgi:hypothetical protein
MRPTNYYNRVGRPICSRFARQGRGGRGSYLRGYTGRVQQQR